MDDIAGESVGGVALKFKRIDVDTVRCLVSEQELMENGLAVEDFLQNDSKTEAFLRRVISQAEEEVGYKVKGGNISIQVSVLPDHVLALTFSEKPDAGILGMLENLKSAVENFSKSMKEESGGSGDHAMDVFRAARETAGAASEEKEEPSSNALSGRDGKYQLCFDSLDIVADYCTAITLEIPVENCLYKLESEQAFFLLIEKGEMDERQLCRLLSAALEFASGIFCSGPLEAYIREHGERITENAVQLMQQI